MVAGQPASVAAAPSHPSAAAASTAAPADWPAAKGTSHPYPAIETAAGWLAAMEAASRGQSTRTVVITRTQPQGRLGFSVVLSAISPTGKRSSAYGMLAAPI